MGENLPIYHDLEEAAYQEEIEREEAHRTSAIILFNVVSVIALIWSAVTLAGHPDDPSAASVIFAVSITILGIETLTLLWVGIAEVVFRVRRRLRLRKAAKKAQEDDRAAYPMSNRQRVIETPINDQNTFKMF